MEFPKEKQAEPPTQIHREFTGWEGRPNPAFFFYDNCRSQKRGIIYPLGYCKIENPQDEETKKTHAAFRGKICSESIILEGKSQPGWKVPWCFSLNSWDPKSIAARLNHVDWICTQLEDIPRKTQLIFGEHLIIFAVLLFWEWVKKIWTLKMPKGLWCNYDDFNTLYT